PGPAGPSPLSLHDALPISTTGRSSPGGRTGEAALLFRPHRRGSRAPAQRLTAHRSTALGLRSRLAAARDGVIGRSQAVTWQAVRDRKSTRLNSSHVAISYA